jgi:hypothetical protein
MTDSVAVFPPGWRLLDANANPVAQGYLEFYNAGTTTPRTVYSDSGLTTAIGTTVYVDDGGMPVSEEGGSNHVIVYTGSTAYKVRAFDADGVLVPGFSFDNVRGALDTSSFAVTSAAPEMPVVSRSDLTWTVDSAYPGRLYNCNVAGGSQTVSFPSAATVGDGFIFGLRHDAIDSTNVVVYQTTGSETIKENGAAAMPAGVLVAYGETRWFVSDGVGWTVSSYVPSLIKNGPIIITDRITAFPASPTGGQRYLFSGTPTGTASTLGFATGDIAEANGIGGWIMHRPTTDCGWWAYVVDENANYQHQDSAWVLLDVSVPTSSALGVLIAEDQKANGTNGGSATSGSRQTRTLNTSLTNTITSASINTSTSEITLPAGTYYVECSAPYVGTGDTQQYFKSTTTSTELYSPSVLILSGSTSNSFEIVTRGYLTLAASETFKVEYQCTNGTASVGLGQATSFTASGSALERYAKVVIIKLDVTQGPAGATGATGATGRDAGIGRWTFNTTTTSGTASGTVRFNSGTFASITTIYLNETDADSRALSTTLDTLDDSTSTVKGILAFAKQDSPGTFCHFEVTAMSDTGTERVLTVTPKAGALPSASDSLAVSFFRTGDAGSITTNQKTATATFVLDGGGSALTTGVHGDLEIPFAGTITAARLLADQTGSLVVDIWKDTYTNYPPTVADTITASAKPTLSAATKYQDTTLTGWTTSVSAGDTLRFNVDSASTITRATLSLTIVKT